MKVRININFIWATTFVNQLAKLGIRHACISPGSRSTPLTYALASNKQFKCFINIDERSSAFFALGIAKACKSPVVIVTTSGTATSELYPAIIEAYQQRTSLIICTADRPSELVGTGANQTINQYNIYRNHIRWFRDVGLPSVKEHSLHYLQKVAFKAYKISVTEKGPVHINFPFAKPLEPFTFNEEIDEKLLNLKSIVETKKDFKEVQDRRINKLVEFIKQHEKGIIVTGPMEFNEDAISKIKSLASFIKYPILADGVSHFRFKTKKTDKYIISNYNSFLSSEKFRSKFTPELVIHFGGTPTSANLLSYLSECDAERFQVNEFGDLHDPSKKTKIVFEYRADLLAEKLIKLLKEDNVKRTKSTWFNAFVKAEIISQKLSSDYLSKVKKLHEPSVMSEIIKTLPTKTNLFIGNSLPIRDFDYFSGNNSKFFNLFFNRGASGIDGVVSTAIGAAQIQKPLVTVVGDLSFLHDLNSLLIARKYKIPLTIVVINNNGGGIFHTLPISKKKKLLQEFFITSQDIKLKKIVQAFGIKHKLIKNKSEFKTALSNLKLQEPIVLEIRTSINQSANFREKINKEIKVEIDKYFSS